MTARHCPHCSAPVRGGGRPSCLCAAIGADDFDPLRVRPYVSLPDGEEDADEADGDAGRAGGDGIRSAGPGDRLDDLPGVDAAVHRADASAPSTPSTTSAPSTTSTPSAPAAPPAASPGPLLPRPRRRSGPTSRTVDAAEGQASGGARSAPRRDSVRARRPAVLVATGAAAAVAAALIGTDALSGGTRDRAAPPDRSTASPSAALPTGDAPTPTGTASSPAAHRSPSPEPTATGPSTATVRLPGTGRPRTPAPTKASGSVSVSPGSPTPSAPPTGPPVLREGAAGPEVAELQERLRQLGLYQGAGGGRYDAEVRAAVSQYQRSYGVTGDPDGVYGPRTRASLEARTDPP
ncbi:peptidoglycan-binding domain-containing protein [Streptomyces kronopolitis]|uniref:peptidoglycan-binding domain-containing protein n=1 Tax=Streptomyces kronopolitis TaxID=1612435 RepID=UPI0027E39994|nr:peptidoglycan-binding protein [Streptomyces kronopolitis]